MTQIQVISTSLVQARSDNGDLIREMELTPWDLQLLPIETIQKGLLFHKPIAKDTRSYIQRLKDTLSSALDLFVPLAGRLTNVEHGDNAVSVSISCNNAGALFVHAIASNVALSDILDPIYVPRIVHSFFPLNGSKNYEGSSEPLLAVQVTELVDGVFIGCSINHSVVDGRSFWHFFNSWAEISRGLDRVSKLPALERWFPEGIRHPIRFPFIKEKQQSDEPPPERVFHFTRENIAQLKAKANAEVSTNKISSLQALLSHVWRSVIRNQRLDPNEDVKFLLLIGARPRISHPPLPDSYFGNALHVGKIAMKAGELIEEGLGNAALEMNKMVSLHTEEKLKGFYESWIQSPELFRYSGMKSNSLATSSSPRFDIYGNDFGWGKPVAVRSGSANKANGKLTVFAGAEEGSIDVELCLPFQILEDLANDPDFTSFASI
ncbi:uncharacterized acetyltransferase At3g50280-like [Neltuma alba]|uniref:uncharacterized acetyltransferase At3g50280-like n=1 Tax=Neltuma alba TaxID=207710 RepID=UPI0010A3174B|nr:uncharacterized acetyltransferase At3g50280-like [Prosopis alba]